MTNTERRPSHPGEILREDVLPALRMGVSDAAKALGVSRQMLHRVPKGAAGVTPEMALRIGKFCGGFPGTQYMISSYSTLGVHPSGETAGS